jgi:hypothetical protein
VSPERHLRWSLALAALFLAMGLWLEAMIGLRAAGLGRRSAAPRISAAGARARRGAGAFNMWGWRGRWGSWRRRTAWAGTIRRATLLGALLVGGGFVAGGLTHGPTDPGPPVLVVPAGALMVLGGVVATALVRPGDRAPGGSR